MSVLFSILILYSGVLIAILIFFLLRIARFYEKKYAEIYKNASRQRTWHQLLYIPMALFAVAAGRYAFLNDFVGDLWGDIALCFGGIMLAAVGHHILRLMTGGNQ